MKLIQAAARGIDKEHQRVILVDQSPLLYDILSINIGSIPEKEPWGLGIKPIQEFLGQWSRVESANSIAIIGGGAGGVEVALSLQERFLGSKKIALIHRGGELMQQAPRGLCKKIGDLCRSRGIQLYLNVENAGPLAQSHDLVIWTTHARGHHMLQDSKLSLNDRGFLVINDQLLCRGEPNIFAVGDCAYIEGQYRARAGVFAVRLARPLAANIRRLLANKPLQRVKLPKNHLALLSTGRRGAIATRGGLYWQAKWIWLLKDHIDRAFMAKFLSI